MTDNFFAFAFLAAAFGLFVCEGVATLFFLLIAVGLVVLALLSGYGVLPEWQG